MGKKDIPDRPDKCPFCGAKGSVVSQHPQFRCKICKRAWLKEGEGNPKKAGGRPKILIVDIETIPMEGLFWGLYKQKIAYQNVTKEWSLVSWAAKWLCEAEIMSQVVSPKDAICRKDKSIINGLWDLMNKAHIVIAHNAIKFDVRKMNARFLINGLGPPLPYQVIDTLRHTQRNFALSSYALDYINKLLDRSEKIKTEYGLWKRCIGYGNKPGTTVSPSKQKEALAFMVKYNRQDIVSLEELYLELRPWMKSHPNLGLYYDEKHISRCPNCGSTSLNWGGEYATTLNLYRAFRCECGAIGRSRMSSLSAEERKNLVSSVAR